MLSGGFQFPWLDNLENSFDFSSTLKSRKSEEEDNLSKLNLETMCLTDIQ